MHSRGEIFNEGSQPVSNIELEINFYADRPQSTIIPYKFIRPNESKHFKETCGNDFERIFIELKDADVSKILLATQFTKSSTS